MNEGFWDQQWYDIALNARSKRTFINSIHRPRIAFEPNTASQECRFPSHILLKSHLLTGEIEFRILRPNVEAERCPACRTFAGG